MNMLMAGAKHYVLQYTHTSHQAGSTEGHFPPSSGYLSLLMQTTKQATEAKCNAVHNAKYLSLV